MTRNPRFLVTINSKNHYGSRSRRGTEVAALYYSLMETAKLCGVDPKRYLREAALAALRGEPIPPAQPTRAVRGGLTRHTRLLHVLR